MSTLFSQARVRVPRFAEAAVERARLTVVPQRPLGRTQAARTPFAVLVIVMLAGGVVGLLMFNTSMQQRSFAATALEQRMHALTAKEQSLSMQLDGLRDPQHLAARAKRLGMVAPAQPAFVRLGDGRVLGTATPAGPDGDIRINPLAPPKPSALTPRTRVVRVPAPEADPNDPHSRRSGRGQGQAQGQAQGQTQGQAGDPFSAQGDNASGTQSGTQTNSTGSTSGASTNGSD
jgi:hypothetical protein